MAVAAAAAAAAASTAKSSSLLHCCGSCSSPGTSSLRRRRALPYRVYENKLRTSAVKSDASERGNLDIGGQMNTRRAAPGTSDEYNRMMQRAMQNPFEYRHENGMYYTVILPDLLVGSQPQTPDDIHRLARREGVTHILNLQQDKDIRYWRVNFGAIQAATKRERVNLVRSPVIDFSGDSLRENLPLAASKLRRIILDGGRAYVHCTAGLGRAPGIAIGYLYWFHGGDEFRDLDYSYEFLTSKRPCGPKKDSIRGATEDMLKIAQDNSFSLGTVMGRLWRSDPSPGNMSREFQRDLIKGLSIRLGDANRHLILEDIIALSETESPVKGYFSEIVKKFQNVL